MFRIKSAKEIEKLEKEYLKLDENFKLNQEAEYYEVNILGTLIGYAQVEKEEKKCIIKRIFIERKHRYKCNGTKLIKFIEKNAIKHGCEYILVDIKEKKSFFEKIGFEEKNGVLIYDKIKERKKRFHDNSKVIILSIIGNIILAFGKITVGITGKSRALFSDGINSLSDVATSVGMLIGVYFSNLPEDDEHPYGHEKIESIIANLLGIFMILTAFELGKGSIALLFAYMKNSSVEMVPHISTIWWGLISAVMKYFMYYYKLKVGKKTGNAALIADAKDSKNDILTSLGAVLGIILAIFVSPIFDILLSLPVAIIIMKEGVMTIFENANLILDKQDKEFLNDIEKYIYENTTVKNVHDIKMRTSGNKIFINLHIRVSKEITVEESHELSEFLEDSLMIDFENLKEVLIHVEPAIE
ncbi:MAG: GNAT family N-acetyltransferase [Fusobacteriaceae bacterium]